MRICVVLEHLQVGAVSMHPPVKSNWRKNMKRLLVVAVLAVGLVAVAGSALVNRHKLVADGNPPPPPKKLSVPWLVADGNPPPPPKKLSVPWLIADGNPPPPPKRTLPLPA
jgi:hypothetical protein